MSSITGSIETLITLINEGKTKEALEYFTNIEKKEDLSQENKLRLKLFKCLFFRGSLRLNEALSLSEEAYQESKKINKPLLLIDSLFSKFMILTILGQRKGFWKYVSEGEIYLNRTTNEDSSEINERKALLNCMRGHIYRFEGKLDPALRYFKESLKVLEKVSPQSNPVYYEIPAIIMVIGIAYSTKGEFELSLKYFKDCIDFQKPFSKLLDAICLNGIGGIYFQKGDINQAIEHCNKSLRVLEKFLSYNYTGSVFTNLIMFCIEIKDLEKAREYLLRFQKYIEKSKGDENFPSYKLAKALILKTSSRTRDRAEAEEILKEAIILHKTRNITDVNSSIDESKFAIMLLCDLYLKELRLTNDINIIDDIQPLIRKLLKLVKRSNSYTDQVYLNIFKGQLSLLQMNMGDARRYFTDAQKIAEEYGLYLIARKISQEHDNLLEQIDKWENLRKNNSSITERMELISLEETIDFMLRKRGIKPIELNEEKPILLLITAETGLLVFSKSFSEEKIFEEMTISKYLTEFNNFNERLFSKGLDRATFGDYTLIMEPINSMFMFYLFKGPSYLARKRLSLLNKRIKSTTPILQAFKKSQNANQMIDIKENMHLESLLTEIFISNKFQVLEEKVVIQKEKKICIVCKGEIVKFFYICECGAIYCETCARAISDLENLCWACNVLIDYSRPVKPLKQDFKGGEKKKS